MNVRIMADSPIRFPGLFGDWAFTGSSVAFHIGGKAIYWYGIIIALGVLLALPLPMTNFVFAGTLLLFALALMERDGALMLALWTVSTAGLVATGLLSEELARLIHGWLA